jgi:predicted transcriptional regulator of viral defense system
MTDTQPSLPASRQRLAIVLNTAGDIVLIADAENALGMTRTQAAKLLSRWAKQGWLRHVGTGAYVPVSLDTLASTHVLDDPWILVPALYAPAYIGGRTAAEHWDLTEQIFRDIVVMTAQPVREKIQQRHGALFALKHVSSDKIFGTRSVWRARTKILVSDIHRTVIDMLDDPALGGGIQHVSDCLAVYLTLSERDDDKLLAYGDRLGNGAVFKRLGFLVERQDRNSPLIEPCRARLTKGHAKLDPALKTPRLITRWKLRVPQSWIEARAHD